MLLLNRMSSVLLGVKTKSITETSALEVSLSNPFERMIVRTVSYLASLDSKVFKIVQIR